VILQSSHSNALQASSTAHCTIKYVGPQLLYESEPISVDLPGMILSYENSRHPCPVKEQLRLEEQPPLGYFCGNFKEFPYCPVVTECGLMGAEQK